MKRHRLLWAAAAVAALAAAPIVVLAQQGASVNPIPGSVWTYLGATYGADWVMPPQVTFPYVPSNAGLAASALTSGQMYRSGFYAAGDGGGATYTYSSTPCSLNGGVGDNGGQVKSIGGGCWNIDVNAQRLIPEIWGAKGTGTDNDTAMVNAALGYVGLLGSGAIFAKEGSKYGIGGTITIKQGTSFSGGNWDNSRIVLLNGSFSPAIKMEAQTVFQDWYVDATPQLTGIVIQLGASGADYRSLVNRVMTNKGCIALDVNGVSQTVRDSEFTIMNPASGCGGIRVGHNTTASGTVEFRLVDTLTKCDYTLPARADYNVLLEDAGGMYFGPGVDNIGCIRGTIIKPGANQEVAFLYCSDAVLGDSNKFEDLLIDTAAASAIVRGNMFVQCWTAGSYEGTGIIIQNTGGGTIAGNSFVGHRVYLTLVNGVQIVKPVAGTITDTSFDAARVCGVQNGSDFTIGDNLDVAIRNSRIGKQCDGLTAGSTTGLLFGVGLGANVQLVATGNDLSYGGVESWSPVSGFPARNSVIGNNTTDRDPGPTYTAASTVTLTILAKRYHLAAAGAATVNTITPTWNGQETCLIGENLAGAITFGTTGNIRYPATIPTGGGMVCGYFDATFSKWILR